MVLENSLREFEEHRENVIHQYFRAISEANAITPEEKQNVILEKAIFFLREKYEHVREVEGEIKVHIERYPEYSSTLQEMLTKTRDYWPDIVLILMVGAYTGQQNPLGTLKRLVGEYIYSLKCVMAVIPDAINSTNDILDYEVNIKKHNDFCRRLGEASQKVHLEFKDSELTDLLETENNK